MPPPTSRPSSPGFQRFVGRPSAPEFQFDWLPGEVMRRFVYCKVVLTTSLVWVLVDVFLLLYFSECNKCDDRKDGSLLPALRGESTPPPSLPLHLSYCISLPGLACHLIWENLYLKNKYMVFFLLSLATCNNKNTKTQVNLSEETVLSIKVT